MLLIGLLPVARADVYTYSYQGNPFNYFYNETCPPTCGITASFTINQPLPANTLPYNGFSNYWVLPDSFTVTDGNITITNNTPGFQIGTGGPSPFSILTRDGVITEWAIGVGLVPLPTNPDEFYFLDSQNFGTYDPQFDEIGICPYGNPTGGPCYTTADIFYAPGSWSVTVEQEPPAPVPEPTSLILLATMITSLCIAGSIRSWVSR